MAKYDIDVQLSGNDGNAFAIISAVRSALKSAGASTEELTQYSQESMSGDYDNLLQVASQWVNIA